MRRPLLVLAALAALALAARLPLLLLSSLPVNIDAFVQVSLAEEILATGRWGLDDGHLHSYNLKMPLLPLFLTAAAELTGVDPLALGGPLMLGVGVVAVLGGAALTHRVTRDRGAAVAAGVVLALLGPFLFLSSTLIKQALGFALLPALLLLVLLRDRPGARLGAAALLLALPLVHHLAFAMAHAFVAFLVLLSAARAHWDGHWSWRRFGLDVATGPALLPVGIAYYVAVRMEFFTGVWNPDEVALLLATTLLVAVAALLLHSDVRARPWFALSKTRRLPSLLDQKAVVVLGAVGLVAANGVRPLVPGTVATSPLLLLAALAYVPLALLALAGLNLHRLAARPGKGAVIALLLAPLVFLLFALLRGLDPLSHVLAYRSFDFLDFGLALAVGTALVRVRRPRRRAVLAVAAVGCLLATLPLAFVTEDAFQVQNTTSGHELAALRHLAGVHDGRVATDQRLASVLTWYFHVPADGSLPLRLLRGQPPPGDALLLVEGNWATRGAQVHPLPFQPLDPDALDRLLGDHDLIYHGGGEGNALYVLRVRP